MKQFFYLLIIFNIVFAKNYHDQFYESIYLSAKTYMQHKHYQEALNMVDYLIYKYPDDQDAIKLKKKIYDNMNGVNKEDELVCDKESKYSLLVGSFSYNNKLIAKIKLEHLKKEKLNCFLYNDITLQIRCGLSNDVKDLNPIMTKIMNNYDYKIVKTNCKNFNRHSNELNKYWVLYKKRFIQDDGRMIDFKNKDITHTESIGYGLYFSQYFNDKQTFEKIYKWLKYNMIINRYGLYSWKWGKDKNGVWRVLDKNNATDGDMFIAYSLLKAAYKFHNESYSIEAKRLIKNIKKYSVITYKGDYYLLPSAYGFNKGYELILAPSYFVPFIFREFARATGDNFWNKVNQTSLHILEKISHLYYLHLMPDFIKLNLQYNKFYLMKNKCNFGYDSIRVPLYLLIDYKKSHDINDKKVIDRFYNYFSLIKDEGYIPEYINLCNNSLSKTRGNFGHYSVAKVLFDYFNADFKFDDLIKEGIKNEKYNYYAFSLYLFSIIYSSIR